MRAAPESLLSVSLMLAAASGGDFEMMVGYRSIIASSVEEAGFRCPGVLAIEERGFEGEAVVLKVGCTDSRKPSSVRFFRVLGYTDGDFEASPWARSRTDQPEQ